MNIEQLASELAGNNTSQNNVWAANESERNGNVNDLLFQIDQAAVSIQGGTTLTNINPVTQVTDFFKDLANGKVNYAGLLWVLIIGGAAYFFLKR